MENESVSAHTHLSNACEWAFTYGTSLLEAYVWANRYSTYAYTFNQIYMSFIARSFARSLANNTHKHTHTKSDTHNRVKTNSKTPSGRRPDTDKETHVHPNVLDFNPPFICMRSVGCVPTLSLSLSLSLHLLLSHSLPNHLDSAVDSRKKLFAVTKSNAWHMCNVRTKVFCLSSRIFIYTWRCKGCFLSVLFPFSSLFSNNSELVFFMNVWVVSLFWEPNFHNTYTYQTYSHSHSLIHSTSLSHSLFHCHIAIKCALYSQR